MCCGTDGKVNFVPSTGCACFVQNTIFIIKNWLEIQSSALIKLFKAASLIASFRGWQNASPSLKWDNKTNLNLEDYINTFRDGPQQPINSTFIYIAQNHDHIASVGFTICTLNPRLEWGKKTKPFNREEIKDGRNLRKGFLSQDRQTCNRCCIYRTWQ